MGPPEVRPGRESLLVMRQRGGGERLGRGDSLVRHSGGKRERERVSAAKQVQTEQFPSADSFPPSSPSSQRQETSEALCRWGMKGSM